MTISFEHVTFRYRRSSPWILRDFSWQIPAGRTVLLGPNGAGKSTLLALGADGLQPHQGHVSWQDLDPSRRRDRATYRRRVGWMPQFIRAVPGLTAREQVAYAGWLKGLSRREAWETAGRALGQVNLTNQADTKAGTLSGGQLRRVGLAQVLVHDPAVLLLDEPMVGLDPAQRVRFREQLVQLPAQLPVVVSTHQVDDLSDLFDTVIVIEEGSITFAGTVAQFLQHGSGSDGARRAEVAYARLAGGEE